MLIGDLFAQQMRADGKQREVIEVSLIITWSRRHNALIYGQMYSTGGRLIYLRQPFLRLARGLPFLWQCSKICFLELSYVNVPTVNLKSCSMNVAIRTRPGTSIRRIYLVTPHCSHVLHVPAFGYD